MDENTQQAQEPVKETQDAPMPSAEEKTTSTEVNALPEGASERTTREFEKLRNELREERRSREALEGAFKTLQPKEAQPEPIYDPDTGYVDPNALTALQRQAQEANQRAVKAEQSANEIRQQLDNREAYQAHPEADPASKEFDPKLKNLAAGIILQSMLNPQEFGGKQFSLKEAYDYLKADKDNSAEVEAIKKEAATEAIEQLTPKEQASLEATGSANRRSDVGGNHETLVQRTRKGDLSAIADRMNRIIGK